jgi:phage terminase small subunit
MTIGQLLEWQWRGYATYHRDRTNLLLHIVAVPLFMAAGVAAVAALLKLSVALLLAGVAGMAVAVAVQGRGHRREVTPPEPFTGAANFIARLLLEQWVTFPRFVLSGGWRLNLSAARAVSSRPPGPTVR